MTDIIRDHDKIYLEEDRKREPKESFKFVLGKAKDHLDRYERPRILDIGCATGDFLFYINSLYPSGRLTGMDVLPELLDRAGKEVPESDFIQANICDRDSLPSQKYDAVFMVGVHSIFDNIHPWLDNIVSLVDKHSGGRAYIFGIFNPEDVDVLVKTRYSRQAEDAPWQSGWNCFSKRSMERALEEIGVKAYSFDGWNIGIDIPRHENDPLRSWTFRYDNGARGIVNGTMILHNYMLLEILV